MTLEGEDKLLTDYKFEIWDTAGQERYRSLAPMYYRGAAAAIVVYDITKKDTFDGAKSWVKELQRRGDPNAIIALAGDVIVDDTLHNLPRKQDGYGSQESCGSRGGGAVCS